MPRELLDWQIRDLPEGDTKLLQRNLETILRYDDFVSPEYTYGSQRFAVYVGNWAKGKLLPAPECEVVV